MMFFETSARSGEGVDNMMYSSIVKLPFFDQYKFENKEILIKELTRINSNKNGNIYNTNNNDSSKYGQQQVDSCYNIELTHENNNSKIEENKKNCSC